MPLTLLQVQTSLTLWQAAYDAVSKGKTFSMNGRTLTRADADECWTQITRLSSMEAKLETQAANRSTLNAKVARF